MRDGGDIPSIITQDVRARLIWNELMDGLA